MATCTLLALASLFASAQVEDPSTKLAKLQSYLEQHPHHEQTFERWTSEAVAAGSLDDLCARYEARLGADDEDRVARVLLARLLAHGGDRERAIALLGELAPRDADDEHLLGRLYRAERDAERAAEHLGAAAARCDDPRAREEILSKLGACQVELGMPEHAVETFRALAAIDPESFHLRMEAATRLALSDFLEAALEELAVAEELAGEDAARRTRVLAEIGGIEERLGHPERALAAYREACGLLGRGHWMQREIFARMLAIQERRGMLQELVALCREGVAADALDPQRRLDLARALDRAGDPDAACATLLGAAADFPADLELGRAIASRLLALGRFEEGCAQHERLIALHPGDHGVALEYARVLAARGEREAARARWMLVLERSPSDVALLREVGCDLLAEGLIEDSVAIFARTIEASPGDVPLVLELVDRLEQHGAKSVARTWIASAEARARERGDANALEALAEHWLDAGDERRARALYQLALEYGGERARLLPRLMELALTAGDLARGTSLFHELAGLDVDAHVLLEWIEDLVRAHAVAGALDRLFAEEAGREEDARDTATLVRAEIQRVQRDWDGARALLDPLIEREFTHLPAHLLLADVQDAAQQHALAAAQYERLSELDPANERAWLQRAASLWYRASDWPRLRSCHDRLVAETPRDARLLREIASFYREHARTAEALEFLERALEVRPDDGSTRIELAELLLEIGSPGSALQNLRLALSSRDARARALAGERLTRVLSSAVDRERLLEELARAFDADPRQSGLALALAQMLVHELDHERALAILDRALERAPRDAELASARFALCVSTNRFEEVWRDLEGGSVHPLEPPERLALELADAHLARGDRETARALLNGLASTPAVLAVWGRHGHVADALRELDRRAAIRAHEVEESGAERVQRLMQRADLLRRAGRLRSAYETLAALAAEHGSRVVLLQLGDLAHRLGDRSRSLACGSALLDLCAVRVPRGEHGLLAETPAASEALAWLRSVSHAERVAEVARYFESRGRRRELAALCAERTRIEPLDLVLLDTALAAYDGWGRRSALELLQDVRASTQRPNCFPTTWDAAAWELVLHEREQRLAPPQSTGNAPTREEPR